MVEKVSPVRASVRPWSDPASVRGGARYAGDPGGRLLPRPKGSQPDGPSEAHKRSIWTRVVQLEPMRLRTIEFTPGTTLDLPSDSRRARCATSERYRKVAINSSHRIPISSDLRRYIDGTRIPVDAVLGRLQDARRSSQDLIDDYPELRIPRLFEAAELYDTAHPLRGQPSGRPWRKVA